DLAGAEPIVVNAFEAPIRGKRRHGVEVEDALEQRAKLLLPRRGHQEIPERVEASALVGGGDRVVLAEDLLEHLALAALGARDPLAHLPVELPEVLLDLAEVGEERPGRVRGLHEALANLRRLEKLE